MTVSSVKTGYDGISLLVGNAAYDPAGFFLIQRTTLSSTGTISFTSIPQTYKHLQIRYLARSARTGSTTDELAIRLNSDSGSNYARHRLSGDGATASATGQASQVEIAYNQVPTADSTASIFGAGIIDILDYASTTKNKTTRTLAGNDQNGSGVIRLNSGLWMNTAAVTSIYLFATVGTNFVSSSSFALYGIK